MSSTPPPLPDSGQRLHPYSWLFLSAGIGRQFLLPLIGLVVFGNRMSERWEMLQLLVPVIAIVLVIATALITQLTYRYTIGSDQLSVRSGLFERQWREIPFSRIHNVSLRQSLLHRLFGVAELKLESAGSPKPEADMKVLPLQRALALEQLIRHGNPTGQAASVVASDAPAMAADAPPAAQDSAPLPPLLTLPPGQLVRMGLLSNRGLILVLAAFGALNQLIPEDTLKDQLREQADHWVDEGQRQAMQQLSVAEWMAAGLGMVVAVLLLTRLLSLVLAFVQYYGFELRQQGPRLTQERGLFSRQRASVGRDRIQAWTLRQPLLHGWFGQRQIRVDIASGSAAGNEGAGFRELVPIIPIVQGDALMQQLAPALNWPPTQWQAVGLRHLWRPILPWLLIVPAACTGLSFKLGPWAWAGLALLAPIILGNWRDLRFRAWHLDQAMIAIRGGSWGRWWRVVEPAKVQGLQLKRSPMDRLCGTASLVLYTAGKTLGEPAPTLHYLPVGQAQQLLEQLSARLSRPRKSVPAYQPAGPQ